MTSPRFETSAFACHSSLLEPEWTARLKIEHSKHGNRALRRRYRDDRHLHYPAAVYQSQPISTAHFGTMPSANPHLLSHASRYCSPCSSAASDVAESSRIYF